MRRVKTWTKFVLSSSVLFALSTLASGQDKDRDTSNAGNEKVAEIIRTFSGRGVQSDGSQPTPPTEAMKSFRMRDGFEIDLVAHEPAVSQPLFLTWDSRGRMWVVQYRQYQFPAGLKIVRYDQHLRAVFDKVPEPPPHGTPGADKITVFEDTDNDGHYDQHKDVITGLNIVTSLQIGRGGIWVLNPPYLLFYPDADGDDVPDGDPEVHLSGFGLQDTHSVASSLLWGPDGWLYGSNGSTTVGTVSSAVTKGVNFQGQCVWRYHPVTKVFEIYSEGGGNTFSLDIDAKGRVFTGTNYGNTRGLYLPQGSYSEKNWGKHGPLTNPYAFGFFRHMKSDGDNRRFAQAFLVYDGGLFPPEFSGDIVAPNAMVNLVWHSDLIPDGSTYRTKDQVNLAESSDRWFRPVYAGVGPDGGVYMADWYDTRLSHVSPIDDWHKESGRIYRIRTKDARPKYDQGDLSRFDASQLLARFAHPNKWVRQRAMLELGWRGDDARRDTPIVKQLVARVNADFDSKSSSDPKHGTLEALWTLNLLEAIQATDAMRWLGHQDEHVRRWMVRILGDQTATASKPEIRLDADSNVTTELARLAERETNVQVRSQLASTAKRLHANAAIPIIRNLLDHDEDVDDLHMPLMIWWAVEAHANNWPELNSLLADAEIWKTPLFRKAIASRLMRRYAASRTEADLRTCVALMKLAPDSSSSELLLDGLNRAFQGRKIPPLPTELDRELTRYQKSRGDQGIVLGVRQGKAESITKAIAALRNSKADLGLRIELANTFGQAKHAKAVEPLLRLATGRDTSEASLQRVAMRSLGQYDHESIGRTLVGAFGGRISGENDLRITACRTLATRKTWARALLSELTSWRLRKQEIPPDVIQQLRTYDDPRIIKDVETVFGKPAAISSPTKIARIEHLSKVLSSWSGDSKTGQAHFTKRCATCHKLFGEGKQIGPPLDAYDRGNLKFWLPAVIEPSLEIREGFQSYLIETVDGRGITGMIAAQDPKTVTLRTADNQTIVVEREDIERLKALKTSLMPEDTLKEMTDAEIADLFAYLSLGAKR